MASLDELAIEYWESVRSLQRRPGPRKKTTRAHKVAHARQIEILKEVAGLRPGNDPMALMKERRPTDIQGYD